MHARRLYYLHHRFAILRAWYFLVLALIFALISLFSLRANYAKMVTLRENVYKVDQENGDIEAALTELRKHVYGHMNTNLTSSTNSIKPPIQLSSRYQRLASVEAEKTKAANQQAANQAEAQCAASFPAAGFNASRVSCIQDYVSQHAVRDNSVPDDLYKFDFVSPRWSPDVAGFSIILTVIFFILFIARISLELLIKKRLQ